MQRFISIGACQRLQVGLLKHKTAESGKQNVFSLMPKSGWNLYWIYEVIISQVANLDIIPFYVATYSEAFGSIWPKNARC